MKILYRVLAEKQIQVPKLIKVTRWISIMRPLSGKDTEVESEILIRKATEEDIGYLAKSYDTTDKKEPILSQDLRFWNQYGFRCLHVGYFRSDPEPICI